MFIGKPDMNNCTLKKILLAAILLSTTILTYAQQDSTASVTGSAGTVPKKKIWEKIDLSNRANDHFMLQYGIDSWGTTPDSINTSGFSRHFNAYAMIDKPFKNSPHMSLGFGLGIGSSNIFFKDVYVNLKSPTTTLPFTNVSASSINRYKKFKLTTVFAELPIELRYSGNPAMPDKGLKAAVGVKIGTLLNEHVKGKDAIGSTGSTLYGNKYILKESNKRFINSTRVAVTGRIGFGNISLDASYQVSNFLKAGVGPDIKPYSVGITISGL